MGKATSGGVETGGSEMLGEFASCQAGMEGPARFGIGADEIFEIVDPRLRSKAFRDFNS